MSFLQNLLAKQHKSIPSYTDLWLWFQKNQKAFFNAVKNPATIEENFFNRLSEKLNELKPGYYYLAGMVNDTIAELVITADGDIGHIAFVEELISYSPAIKNWKFTALKNALDISDVTIRMGDYTFSADNLWFYATDTSDYPDEINISMVYDDMDEENRNQIENGIHIFLDNYLGELTYATSIDNLSIVNKIEVNQPLIPIEKLKSFLEWRQKEFGEKYQGTRHDTEHDQYASYKAELESGKIMLAIANTDLLDWDSKASHPWILRITMQYDGAETNGLPDVPTYKLLDELEKQIEDELRDSDGYLNVARETGGDERIIYFACQEFRKPSVILYQIQKSYKRKLAINYEIFKDKYWQSLEKFNIN